MFEWLLWWKSLWFSWFAVPVGVAGFLIPSFQFDVLFVLDLLRFSFEINILAFEIFFLYFILLDYTVFLI